MKFSIGDKVNWISPDFGHLENVIGYIEEVGNGRCLVNWSQGKEIEWYDNGQLLHDKIWRQQKLREDKISDLLD